LVLQAISNVVETFLWLQEFPVQPGASFSSSFSLFLVRILEAGLLGQEQLEMHITSAYQAHKAQKEAYRNTFCRR
jgi:hypothetical protein